MTTTTTSQCPLCRGEVELPGNIELSEVLPCPDCDAELEVVSISPVMLEPFEEEEK